MMKKVAILTWLNNKNYGSILQAYALQSYISQLGYEVVNIDYDASIKEKFKNWLKQRNSISLYKDKFDNAFLKFKSKNRKDFVIRNQLFENFKNKYIVTTRKYKRPCELEELNNKFDIYICGSDQIWSPKLMNPIFYYSFLQENSFKIAYAPSFGVTSISNDKKKKIKKLISSFKYVSIREEQGEKILKELFNREYPVLIDPTLLIKKEDWKKIATNCVIGEDYILCYFLTPNKKYINIIKEYAKNKNLKTIIITTPVGPFNTGFEEKAAVGPSEWVGYMKNAKYIFTDSFHGIVFSIIFNKQFTVFKRFSDKKSSSQNSRIYNLLKICNLPDRIYDEKKDVVFDKKINYKKVNDDINYKIEQSKKWLKEAMKGENNG